MTRHSLSIAALIAAMALSALDGHVARADPILQTVRDVQRDLGTRVGFYLHDLQTGTTLGLAEEDRFSLNSTFKLFACGAFLHRVTTGDSALSTTVPLDGLEVAPYSPAITSAQQAGRTEITLGEACAMMLSVSDNTAANIILAELGGPAGLTSFWRAMGDPVSRLDRWEPDLNAATPGDLRDTTAPRAIATSLERLLLGDVLTPDARAILRDWLAGHQLAGDLFRAVLPPDWRIEDRTGAGGFGARSIIAVLYPLDRAPIVVALYIAETSASFVERNAAAARVGQAIVDRFGGNVGARQPTIERP